MPPANAASGPPLATCRACGVAVRFLPGFEPVLTGWLDDTCPACQAEESRARARWMTRDEQRDAIFDALRRDPTATVRELVLRTGCQETFVRGVRRKAVSQRIARPLGHASPAHASPAPEAAPPRPKTSPKSDTRQAIKAALADGRGRTVVALIDATGVGDTAVRRNLHKLVEAGEVEARGKGLRDQPVTYRLAKGSSAPTQ